MGIASFFLRIRSRSLWSDPIRKIQTLESFSQTEIDAGESILRSLKHVDDPQLRAHLERHAKDELRHGDLFRIRAQELLKLKPNIASIYKKPDKLYKLSSRHTATEFNSHGFFTSDYFEKLDEITYVAMLNIAEKKAEKTFVTHHYLNRDDPETHAIFKKILKDERYHVSYTNKFLQQWRKEGRVKEVNKAISFARRSHFINSLSRMGSKFGEHAGHAILYVIYFTIIIPFAFMSKLSYSRKGWGTPVSKTDTEQVRSQY